jgi:hypothetical protein
MDSGLRPSAGPGMTSGGLFSGPLILIFVIWIVELAEPAMFNVGQGVQREGQLSAKTGNSHPIGRVKIADETNAIQFRTPLLDVSIFLSGKNPLGIDIVCLPIEPAGQSSASEVTNGWNRWIDREVSACSYDQISNSYLHKDGVSRSIVDASQIYNDRLALPDVVRQPQMFYADFGSMCSNEFIASQSDLAFASEIQSDGC